jgi:hypothetical protein
MRSLSFLRTSTAAASVVEYAALLGIMGVISVFAVLDLGAEVRGSFNEPVQVLASNGLPNESARPETDPQASAPAGPIAGWSVSWLGDDATYTANGQFFKQFSVFHYDPMEGAPGFEGRIRYAGVAGRGDGLSGSLDAATANAYLGQPESEYHLGNIQASVGLGLALGGDSYGAIAPSPGIHLCEAADPVNFTSTYTAGVANVQIADIATTWIDDSVLPSDGLNIGGGPPRIVSFDDVQEIQGDRIDTLYATDEKIEVVSTFRCVRDALPGDDPVLGQMPYTPPPTGGGGGFGGGAFSP